LIGQKTRGGNTIISGFDRNNLTIYATAIKAFLPEADISDEARYSSVAIARDKMELSHVGCYRMNTYYEPGAQRATKVNELFTRIAGRYDLMNDLQSFRLHRYWKKRVVKEARPQAGESALDLCCGTGDIALGLARKGAEVTGLDFSEEMLKIARERQTKEGSKLPRMQFVSGDAQKLPFGDATFDIVTISYGLRNLTSWETGLREMQRVSKPGGRLVILEFGKPENTLWRAIYEAYLKLFSPALGLVFCADSAAYSYILESLKDYPAQRIVGEKMREMGLENVRVINLLGGAMSINYGVKNVKTLKR
jgi:demethylmenaquinone methyltransferase/2-methoxy-6-polyprenyl-1,4-benzoquinol methylase